MPNLTSYYLPDAFYERNEIHYNSSWWWKKWRIDVGALINHHALYSNPNATVHTVAELNALDSSVETIIVDVNGCVDQSFTVLNLTRFVNLKVLEIGNYSFTYVKEVYMTGLSKLESVIIGRDCFRVMDSANTYDDKLQFHLRDCASLRELEIGYRSFYWYGVCEIDNLPSLETIDIGVMGAVSKNFAYASLELKSESEKREWGIDMPQLKSLAIGNDAFSYGMLAVFESDSWYA